MILDGTVFDWRGEASRVYAKECLRCPRPIWDGEKHECPKPPAQTVKPRGVPALSATLTRMNSMLDEIRQERGQR